MSIKGFNVHLPITKYPGPDYYYVICDVCGKKFRKKDTCYIVDKFNLQNRLLVCFEDKDKAQPQLRPFKAREYRAPELTRPDVKIPDILNPAGDIVPSAPTQVQAVLDPLTNNIDLLWLGPTDNGSDTVIGYAIYQSNPQLAGSILIDANTLNSSPFYQDPTTPITAICSYQVAAINSYGQGALSAPAYFPSLQVDLSIQYLIVTPGGYVLDISGSGEYFNTGVLSG